MSEKRKRLIPRLLDNFVKLSFILFYSLVEECRSFLLLDEHPLIRRELYLLVLWQAVLGFVVGYLFACLLENNQGVPR